MRYLSILIISFSLFNCSDETIVFDGEKSMEYLVQQCDIGVRNPGSTGHEKAKEMYISFLKNHADTVIAQNFSQYIEPDDVTFELTNIIAGFDIEKGNSLLIGAHWDTRPRAEHAVNPADRDKPIIGANDGASGIAVLMHLAEILQTMELNRSVYLVFFDGEDYGFSGDFEYFCMGSKYFAKNLPVKNIKEAIIIDMIGDCDLSIPMERNSYRSNKKLMKKIWNIAKARGYKSYKNQLGYEIYDDHVPFIEAGIPAIDIIDFDYPNKYKNYWHTHQDTPDKCCPESLKQIGQVLVDYLMLPEENK